ncbi:hypothetical protein FCV25MIE_01734 [Fagus crenata]
MFHFSTAALHCLRSPSMAPVFTFLVSVFDTSPPYLAALSSFPAGIFLIKSKVHKEYLIVLPAIGLLLALENTRLMLLCTS